MIRSDVQRWFKLTRNIWTIIRTKSQQIHFSLLTLVVVSGINVASWQQVDADENPLLLRGESNQDQIADDEITDGDKLTKAVIVFIVPPNSISKQTVPLYPINHDLLEGFALEYGIKIQTYSLAKDIKAERFIKVSRFNDPLKMPKQAFATLTIDKTPDIGMWESPDSRSLKSKLSKLVNDKSTGRPYFLVLAADQVRPDLLSQATRRTSWTRVPTRYRAYEAHPDGNIPNLKNFPVSDILSPTR